jgi:hypothetical protein
METRERGSSREMEKIFLLLIFSCKHCSKDGHDEDHCWKLHLKKDPKSSATKGSQRLATIQHDLGSNSGDETPWVIKVRVLLQVLVLQVVEPQ